MKLPKSSRQRKGASPAGTAQAAQSHITAGAADVEMRVGRLTKGVFALTLAAAVSVVISVTTVMSSNAEHERLEGGLTDTVVASVDIPAGTVITADMLTVVGVPSAFLSSSPTAEADYYVGKTASVSIGANSQMTVNEVSGERNASSLAGKTTKGSVSFTLNISGTGGLAGNLKIGDTVDIYRVTDATMSLVATGMKIVAMDTALTNADGSTSYSTLSFEGPKSTARKLLLAQEKGTLVCTLSPLADADSAYRDATAGTSPAQGSGLGDTIGALSGGN